MDPSSLIFVAIIGIWAAYLLGHWVRRRDQLATARSIDRFSSAMRVLERRAPVPALAHPQTRGYVVAPVRPVYARMTSGAPTTGLSRTSTPPAVRPAPQGDGEHNTGPRVDVRAGSARSTAVRRRRLLAALSALTLTGWVLVIFTALPWWGAALPTLALVVLVAQLRALARRRRQRHRRQLATQQLQATRLRRESLQAVVGQVVASRGQRLAASAQRAADASAAPAVERAGLLAAKGSAPAEAERLAEDVSGAQPSTPAGAGWQPVPVPPPTYTLKPKAPTVIQARVTPTPATSRPEATWPDGQPADDGQQDAGRRATSAPPVSPAAPTFDLDEILERRIASGA